MLCVDRVAQSVATDYELDGPGSYPVGDEIFRPVQTGPRAQPTYCKMLYRFFPRGKVRPGIAADHSPPSSTTVMEE